jgi:hypothetical protein
MFARFLSLIVDYMIVFLSGVLSQDRTGALESIGAGLKRRFNLQLSAGQLPVMGLGQERRER